MEIVTHFHNLPFYEGIIRVEIIPPFLNLPFYEGIIRMEIISHLDGNYFAKFSNFPFYEKLISTLGNLLQRRSSVINPNET